MKYAYKPFGLVISVLGGIAAGALCRAAPPTCPLFSARARLTTPRC